MWVHSVVQTIIDHDKKFCLVRWCKLFCIDRKYQVKLKTNHEDDGDFIPGTNYNWVPFDKLPQAVKEKLIGGRVSSLVSIVKSNRRVIVPGRIHPASQKNRINNFFIKHNDNDNGSNGKIKAWDFVLHDPQTTSDDESLPPPAKKSRGSK